MKLDWRTLFVSCIAAITIFSLEQGIFAQATSVETEIVPASAKGCQQNIINIANLGALVQTTKEKAFVIAHLGARETLRQLNQCRLEAVRAEFGDNWNVDKVILAEGKRVKGQGRIEFYLGSKLMHVSLVKRNGTFCTR